MDINRLMDYSGKLKEIKRTGWVESGIESPESVADHSYRTTLLSMVLSDEKGLNTLKTMKMALLHDLAESVTGDLTPKQKEETHNEKESKALKKAINGLPEKIKKSYLEVFTEFQENKTLEAQLVHNADKIDMLYQTREYEKKGYWLDKFWETKLDSKYDKYRPERD